MNIETDIPLPAARHSGKHYPFAQMKPGHSFAIPNATKSTRISLYNHARKFTIKHQPEWQFTVRVVDDGKNVRCWRIK